jgi:hypothetical protein
MPASRSFGLGSLDDATEDDNRSKNWERIPCLAGSPYCPSIGVDQFDILACSPGHSVRTGLGLVAAQREGHIVCELRQPNLAGLHGNTGFASNSGARHNPKLVGTEQVVPALISGSRVSQFWRGAGIQSASNLF